MPFYIRKSVSVGPFRFNLSKSGIGLSAGVKGFRVGTGPRGNYVHMGRNGLYYRASLNGPRPPRSSPTIARHEPSPENLAEIETGQVVEMADTNAKDVLGQINEVLATLPVWPFLLFPGLTACMFLYSNLYFASSGSLGVLIVVASGLALYLDRIRRSVVLMYELDSESSDLFETLTRSFDLVRQSTRIWNIQAQGPQPDWKRNAGATKTLKRTRANLGYRAPSIVKTNISVPAITGGRQSLYFFPDLLLVLEGRQAGVVSYANLSIQTTMTNFIETESVPSDSRVSHYTWKYVNKGGGPDRRFNGNRQLPVVNYQEIELTSSSGLRKLLQVSRVEDRSGLIRALANLGKFVDTALADSPSRTVAPQVSQAPRSEQHEVDQTRQATASQYYLAYFALAAVCILTSAVFLYPVILNTPATSESSFVPAAEASPASTEPETLSESQKVALEKDLLEKVRPIPASNYAENLKIYLQLVQLRPTSDAYRRKVERYSALLRERRTSEAPHLNSSGSGH
jgi:hypothetical protein